MLTVLTHLGDTVRLDEFLSDIVARNRFDKSDNVAIIGALGLLSPDRSAALVEHIIAATATTSLGPCGDLMARAAAAPPHGRLPDLIGAANRLVEALPGDPARVVPREPRQRDAGVQSGFVVDLFTALVSIDQITDQALAERAVDHILAWPKVYELDKVLVPAVRDLIGATGTKVSTAVQRLRIACVATARASRVWRLRKTGGGRARSDANARVAAS